MSKRRKDGRIQRSITVIEQGVKQRKYFYGHSEREIMQKIVAYKEDLEKGRLFEAVAGEWAARHFPTLAPRTLSCYEPALKRAIARFSGRYVRSITPMEIQQFIFSVADQGLAHKTVSNQRVVLNLIFRYCVLTGEVTYNPVSDTVIPKNLPKEKRTLPPPHEIDIIKRSADAPFGLFYLFILYTGARRGEALAITYEDIDFDCNTISINKSIYHIHNIPHLKAPKSEAGIRCVPLLEPLKKALPHRENGYLFPNAGNGPMTGWEAAKSIMEYQKATGVTASPHQLRHAYATILFEAGLKDRDRQELLGHAQINTTMDYTHITDWRRAEYMERLNQYLTGS